MRAVNHKRMEEANSACTHARPRSWTAFATTHKALASVQVTWSFISKNFLQSTDALRDVFFCDETPRAELERLRETFNAQATDMRLLDLKVLRVRRRGPCGHCPCLCCPQWC